MEILRLWSWISFWTGSFIVAYWFYPNGITFDDFLKKAIFHVSDSIFYIKKKIFSIASDQFETNLTFLGQTPSPIQL